MSISASFIRRAAVLLLASAGLAACAHAQTALAPHRLTYAPGKTITLSLPSGFDIDIAASGLHRVRFFAQAPDGRIFVTGMHDRSDNTLGSVFILDG